MVKKAVIFDLDGTLIDAFEGIHETLMHTLRHFGFPEHPFAVTKRMVGHGLHSLLAQAMNADIAEEAVVVYRARYAEIAVSSAHPLPHAEATLKKLHAAGVRIALASNKPSYFSRQILEGRGWAPYFSAVRGPDLVAAPKPHPAMIESILVELSLPVSDALYVGDMTVDLETAQAAGIEVALVATGSMTARELRAAGAEKVLGSLDQLIY